MVSPSNVQQKNTSSGGFRLSRLNQSPPTLPSLMTDSRGCAIGTVRGSRQPPGQRVRKRIGQDEQHQQRKRNTSRNRRGNRSAYRCRETDSRENGHDCPEQDGDAGKAPRSLDVEFRHNFATTDGNESVVARHSWRALSVTEDTDSLLTASSVSATPY